MGPTTVLNNTNCISSGAGSPWNLWEDNPYVPKDEQIVPTALLFALCVVIPLGKQPFLFGQCRELTICQASRMVSDFSEIDREWNDATNCHMESFDWVKLWDFFAAEIAMDFHRMFNISGIELSKGMTRRQLDGTFLAWHFLSETMVLFPISIFLHQFSAENHPKGGSFLSVCQASWLWCPGSKWSQETLLRLCTLVCSQTWL